MPNTSSARYLGTAFAVITDANRLTSAETQLDVDFGQRKLSGIISNWYEKSLNLKDISINATISGNTFKGDNNQGKFYGPNAQNLAGSFADKNQKIQGVFSANKQ